MDAKSGGMRQFFLRVAALLPDPQFLDPLTVWRA
jgi:hypothetical protein